MIKYVKILIITLLGSITMIVFSNSLNAESHKKTLLRAFEKCKQIKSGTYDVVYHCIRPFHEDTSHIAGRCAFNKVPADKTLGAKVELTEEGTMTRRLHDGRYNVKINPREHTARVSDLQENGIHYIAGNIFADLLFEPLITPTDVCTGKKENILERAIRSRTKQTCQLPEAIVAKRTCNVFKVNCEDSEEVKDETITLFIDQELGIPIKYIHKKTHWGSQMHVESSIYNFTLIRQRNPRFLTDARAQIPKGFSVVHDRYTKETQDQLLAKETTAPLWQLTTLQGKTISLAELRGKVILLSFWYRSFEPCLHYLKELERLHRQFKDQDVVVVGINLYDDREELTEFLQQRDITYTHVVDNAGVKSSYRAYTPNTLYIIDKKGVINYAITAHEKFPKTVLCRHIKALLSQ